MSRCKFRSDPRVMPGRSDGWPGFFLLSETTATEAAPSLRSLQGWETTLAVPVVRPSQGANVDGSHPIAKTAMDGAPTVQAPPARSKAGPPVDIAFIGARGMGTAATDSYQGTHLCVLLRPKKISAPLGVGPTHNYSHCIRASRGSPRNQIETPLPTHRKARWVGQPRLW